MAVTILDVNSTTFSINGIEYLKNFMSIVNGDLVKILNVYDSKVVLQEPVIYSDYTVDGGSFASAALLQSALKDVLFDRGVLSLGYNIINNVSDLDSLIASATSGVWLINSDITLDGNKTLPGGVALKFIETKIDLNGFTLSGSSTIIDADMSQIFNLNGGTISGTWEAQNVQSFWFGVTQNGVDDNTTQLQAAIDFVEASALGTLYISNGTILTSAAINVNSCVIQGRGGHLSKSIIQGTATTGNVINITNRSAGLKNVRIDASSARRSGGSSVVGGVFVSRGDIAGATISRTILNDVYITNQSGFGLYTIANIEYADYHTITVEGCVGHPFIFDDGTFAGYTNKQERPFNATFYFLRALSCGGNVRIGNLSNTSEGYMLRFVGLEALDCAFDAAERIREEQVLVNAKTVTFDGLDIENQNYASGTDGLGNSKAILANPVKGVYFENDYITFNDCYFSSLTHSILAGANTKNITIKNPIVFSGTYGVAQTNAIEIPVTCEGFYFNGTTQSGATTLLKNQCVGAEIYLDGLRYYGISLSTKDWKLDKTGTEYTISGGTLDIDGNRVLILGQGGVADSLSNLRIQSGVNGYESLDVFLINENAYDITITNSGNMVTNSGEDLVLNNDVFCAHFMYDTDNGTWHEVGIQYKKFNSAIEIESATYNDHLKITRSGVTANITLSGSTLVIDKGFRPSGTGSVDIGATGQRYKDGYINNLLAATQNLSGIPTYADEAAAVTGGAATGDVYKTATGELRIKL